jgi:hypothetical protein
VRILGYLPRIFLSFFSLKASRPSGGVVWFIPHDFNKFNAGFGGLLSVNTKKK